jgi:hypothetical protein
VGWVEPRRVVVCGERARERWKGERRGNGAGEEGRREKDARWGKGGLAEARRIGQVFPVCRRRASAWRLILYLACPRVSAAVTLTPGTTCRAPARRHVVVDDWTCVCQSMHAAGCSMLTRNSTRRVRVFTLLFLTVRCHGLRAV